MSTHPNPSVERTSKKLRLFAAAPVERQASRTDLASSTTGPTNFHRLRRMPTRNKPQSQLGSGASRKAEQAKARRIATLHEKIQRTATELTRLLDSGEFFKPVRKVRPRKTPRTATSFQVATIGTVTITSNVAPDFYKYPSFKDKIKTEGLRLSGRLAFTYAKTPGDETRRTVLLLGAYPASMPQYLVGHCELRNEERTFVIDRISLVTNLLDGQAVHDLRQWLTSIGISIGVRSQT